MAAATAMLWLAAFLVDHHQQRDGRSPGGFFSGHQRWRQLRLPWSGEAGDYQPEQRVGEPSNRLARQGSDMDLTASQAADRAAAILQGLDADAKRAGDQAAAARAWLDLARYLREDEQRSPSVPDPSGSGRRVHPDALTG
jgi:hypothetical protein